MADAPYAKEIAVGESWLDENHPGWVERFAADRAAGLHMSDCGRCVLGHVVGNYRLVVDPTPVDADPEKKSADWAVGHGFALGPPATDSPEDLDAEEQWEARWDDLSEAWRAVIEKRLADQGLMTSDN